MPKDNRSWIDWNSIITTPPQLDENNLPVENPIEIDPNSIKLPSSNQSYYQNEYLNSRYKKLRGTAKPFMDEEAMADAVQPFGEKLGRGIVSRGASLAPKIGENIGHIGGAISFGMDYLQDPESADPTQIWDNGFVNAMGKIDENLRESLPIFKSFQGRNGNLLQQMKDPGFWFDDFFDSLAFLGSAYVTGAGIGAIASASSKALGLTANMAQKAKVYGSTLLNSIGEAGFESKDFNDTERELRANNLYGLSYDALGDMEKEKIKAEVSEGAANVFRGNLGVLIVPNYIQSKFMFGKIGKAAEELRTGVRAGRIASEDINIWKKTLGGIGTAIVSEGPWEEGMQNALQTYSKRQSSFNENFSDYAINIGSEWVDNLFTTDGQKNIVLGSLMGGIFGGFGGRAEAIGEKKEIGKEEDIFNILKGNMSGYDKLYIDHVTKPYKKFTSTVQETQPDGTVVDKQVESYLNKDGKTEFDLDALQRMFMHTVNNKFLFDEAMVATINADNVHLDTVNRDALSRLYYFYATDSKMSSLDEVDDLLIKRDLAIPDDLAKLGYDKKFSKADIQPMRDAFEKARNQMYDAQDFTTNPIQNQFKNTMRKTLFAEDLKRNMYENYLSNENISDKQKEDIRRLIKDSEKITKAVLDKNLRGKLFEQFKQEREQYTDVLKRFEEVNKDVNATVNDKVKAQYDRDEFLYIEGPENPFSPAFSQSVIEGSKTANVFGARYNYFFNLGKSAFAKANVNKAIEDAGKGRAGVADVVNTVRAHVDDGIVYSEEDLGKVDQMIQKRRESLDRASKQVEERKQRLATNTPKIYEVQDGFPTGRQIDNPTYNQKQQELDQTWIDNYTMKEQDYTAGNEQFTNLKQASLLSQDKAKTDKSLMKNRQKAYRKFQREYADTPIEKAKDLLLSFRGNKDAFDQADEVDNTIAGLEQRKKIYNMPGRKRLLTTNEFKGYIENVDKAIEELKAIRNKAFENKESRKALDKRTRRSYSSSLFKAIGIEINREKKSYSISDQVLYDAIADIMGKENLDGILERAKSETFNETDYSFDGVFVEKIISKIKDSKDGVKKLQDVLKKLEKEKIESFIDLYYKWAELDKKGAHEGNINDIKSYRKNPFRAFDRMIEVKVDRFRVDTDKISPVDQFFRNKDVFQLLDAVENKQDLVYKNLDRDTFAEIIRAHIDIMGIARLRDRLISKISVQEMIGLESEVIKEKKLAPSNQQHIALREAMVEMSTPVEKPEEKFRGWYYIKGLAGTGKTDLMANYLPDLLKIPAENIIALSTHENALEVLKKSLPGVKNTLLVDGLTDEMLKDDKTKLIIIDEIARINAENLHALADRIAEANKSRKSAVRIYVLGDPSQVASAEDAFPAINNYTFDMANIKELSPLTSVFRSGNSAVLRAQNAFLDFPGKVKSFLGIASADIGMVADGVHVSNIQQRLIDQLELNKKSNNRSRVIVISNPVLKKQYEKTGVPVMLYHEVASLSYDEVYTDINPVDFDLNRKFNEAMYTALSRARSYIFLRSYQDADAWKYSVDEVKQENNETRNKEIVQEYTNRLSFEINVMGEDMKGVKVSSPQMLNVEQGDPDDIASQQSEQDEKQEEPLSADNTPQDNATFEEDVATKDGSIHELEYPSYYPIKPKTQSWNDIKRAPVRTGSRVKYIKVWNSSGQRYEVHVIAEQLNIDDKPLENPVWDVIGILSENELMGTEFGKALLKRLNSAKKDGKDLANKLSQGNTGKLLTGTGPTILAEGVIHKAQPLSYTYQNDIVSSGPGFLTNLMDKVRKTFGKENIEFQIKIYSKSDNNLTPGVPYLEIYRTTKRGGKEETGESQFIRLTARKIRNTDSIIQPIIEFQEAITQLEEEGLGTWGDPKTNELIKRFRKNFTVEDDKIVSAKRNKYTYNRFLKEVEDRGFRDLTEKQFKRLQELSQVLIPAFYGAGNVKVEVENEDEMWDYLGDNKKTDPNTIYEFKEHPKATGGYILKTNRKNEEEKEYVYDSGLVAGEGTVQKRMNVLARANNKLSFSISHKTSTYRGGKRRFIISSESKSLFAESTSTAEYIDYLKNMWRQMSEEAKEMGQELPPYSRYIDKESHRLSDEENVATIENVLIDWGKAGSEITGLTRADLDATRSRFTKEPLTSADINSLLTFDQNGDHGTVHLPLKMNGPYGINELGKDLKTNLNALEDIMGTKLSDISRTRIQVKLDGNIIQKELPVQKGKNIIDDSYHKLKNKFNDRKKRLMKSDPKVNLGIPLTFTEARSLLAKFIPTINDQGKDVLRFVNQMIIDEIAGEKAYGVYHDEVIYAMDRDGKTFKKIIRHETFHKIFNEYLTPGEQNRLVNAFKNQFPEYSSKGTVEIEELLAEKFQDYQTKKLFGINKVLMDFFNWLAKTFSFINLNTKNLDRFFETIESGYFVTSKESAIGITRAMRDIIKLYGSGNSDFAQSLEVYRNARAIIQQEFYDVHENGIEGFPVTRREVRSISRQNIQNDMLIISSELNKYKVSKDIVLTPENEQELLEVAKQYNYYRKAADNFNQIIDDLYPNWNFDQPGEITVDADLSTEEILAAYEEDEDEGVRAHIIESDEVNWEAKHSMAVKDFLSNIPLGKDKFMNWREAYVRTLQLFEGLQPDSDTFIAQLEKAWKDLGRHYRTEFLLNKVKELHTNAISNIYGKEGETLSDKMKFVDENLFVISDKSVEGINGESGARVNNAFIEKRQPEESTREFIIRIALANQLTNEEVSGHFRRFQAIDQYKSLINLFNNQKQKNLYLIEKTWNPGGTYTIGYIPGSYIGPHKSLGSLLSENIRNYFPDKKTLDKFMKDWLKPNLTRFKGNPYEFIKLFLKEMGMGSIANNIPTTDVQQIYYDIEGFFSRAKDDIEKVVKVETEEGLEDQVMTIGMILQNEEKMVNHLAKLMSVSSAYIRATNVKDVKGKRKYLWSPASFAHNIFFNLVNNKTFKNGNMTLDMPEYLKTDFFKNNIFINGKNRIHDIVDSDGIKQTDAFRRIKDIKQNKESTSDFILRGFMAGFLDRIRYSKAGQERYFQFVYPNERENVIGAEINVLTAPQAQEAIKDAIRQFNTSKRLDGIKQDNKNRFINFHLLETVLNGRDITTKPLTDSEINKYSDKIMRLLSIEAEKLAQTIVDNRIPFDKDMFTNKGLERFTGPEFKVESFKNSKFMGKDVHQSTRNKVYTVTVEQILPLTQTFITNNYINSFFLNQTILGDNNQFKNEEDVMRRFSLATAPGSKGLVNKILGMREKSRFMVIGDQMKGTDDIRLRLDAILRTPEEKAKLPFLMEKFKENFALGDGQGFMTPERFEELRNAGFATEFSLHKVLKPVVYSISADGVVHGVKYSSIVLSDDLIKEFPSLGQLLINMRKNGADEAVFASAVKIGMPQSTASYSDILSPDYTADPSMFFDVNNDQYRIQLDPKSKIEGKTSQPSQLIYLASVLSQNTQRADRIYYHLSELSRLGDEKFFSKFNSVGTIQRNIKELLRGKGNERSHDMLASGLSINFPSVVDKVVISLASQLKDNIVEFDFPGTKLVLQSEYATRKYGQTVQDGPSGKLRYIRTDSGRLVAECIIPEGLLPKEYEDMIKSAMAEGKNARDYFDLPDLLGFRIPSSDIHSAIAIKVAGFYKTKDVNVIIAPDLLVALHGSDFDVDSLFIIKRSVDKEGNFIGYQKKKGRMTFIRDSKFEDINDEIGFRKNAIVHELLDLVSNEENIENMLSPIPLREIQEQKARVLKLRGDSQQLDLSNYNDVIKTHDTIFGASIATGIFGNAAKALAYMMRTGIDGSDPQLIDETNILTINDKQYDKLTLFDDTGQSLFVSIDGFINASIDNIKLLALPVLNISRKTIAGFIGMRSLGIPLNKTIDILQQPAILEYNNIPVDDKVKFKAVREKIIEKLSGYEPIDMEINDENLSIGLQLGISTDDIKPVVSEKGRRNQKSFEQLSFQLKILNEFQKMFLIGNSIGDLGRWLKIARTLPPTKMEIEKIIDNANKIFGVIEDDGSLPTFTLSSFPFDIIEFFNKAKHILQVFKSVKKFDNLLSNSIKKFHPEFEKHIGKAYEQLGKFGVSEIDGKNIIRDELITYLMSNEIYSGEYKLDRNVTFEYQVGKEKRILTGPKAVNQIFINKVIALKNFINKERNSEGEPLNNTFLERLSHPYNAMTRTYELSFEGGSNMDQMDILDIQSGFYELNKYEVNYNKKTGKYSVKKNTEARADNDYSNFQREFVSYGIMNWGLKFGLTNYSFVLPSDLYQGVDNLFNNLMDKFTGVDAEENWSRIEDDFMIQLVLNNPDNISDIYRIAGKPLKKGEYVNDYNQTVPFYGGKTEGFYYDRSYSNTDEKDMPRFIVSRYKDIRSLYLRLNDTNAPTVYYQRIDRSSPIKFYNTSDEVLKSGYNATESFINQGIYNVQVDDLNNKEFTYYGDDLKEGDIVTFTQFHDATRINKIYKQIYKKLDDSYLVKSIEKVKTKHAYQEILSTADSIITDTKKRLLKKGMPFRSDNKGRGRIMMAKYQTGEARTFKNNINKNEFAGFQVFRERLWHDGIEVYLDRDELMRFFGRAKDEQITKFYSSYQISLKDQTIVEEGKKIIMERTQEDDELEKNINEVVEFYTKEKDLGSLIDNMISRSRSKRRFNLLLALKDRILKQNLKIVFGELLTPGKYGEYSLDGSIILDLVNLYEHRGRLDIDHIDRILFHEMVHGLTVVGMLENESLRNDISELIKEYFRIEDNKIVPIEGTLKIMQKYLLDNGYNMSPEEVMLGAKDSFEFVAEILSNDVFAEMMHKVKNQNKSLLSRIIDSILEFLGLAKESAIDFLNTILNSPYTPSFTQEGEFYRSSSGKVYSDKFGYDVDVEPAVKTDVDEIRKQVVDLSDKIQENSSKAKVKINPDGTEGNAYIIEGVKKEMRRITDRVGGFISIFSNTKIDPNISFGEHMADLKWGTREKEQAILTDQGNMETYDQYKARMEMNSKLGSIKGQIIHLYLKRIANRLFHLNIPDESILKEINNVSSRGEGKTPADHYNWIENPDVLKKVFRYAGINVLSKDIPEILRDIIYLPEIHVWNELLGFGGTIDSLIGHADGRWSIKDWKSGNAFGIRTTTEPMKYGLQSSYISDNQRERAKLQVMLYAFLLKMQYPDIKFKDLMTVWIPNQFLSEKEDMDRFVDVSAYLSMIKAFLNDKQALKDAGIDPDAYNKILKDSPKIFDISEYTDKSSDSLIDALVTSDYKPEEEYRRRVTEIQAILGRLKERRQIRLEELPEDMRKRLAQLYEEVAIMRADPSMQLDVFPGEDIGAVTEWLGNYSDVNMGMFQTWVKIRNGEWNTYTFMHEEDIAHVNKLMEPILNEYMKGKVRIRRGGMDRIANINYPELYHFAFKEEEKNGYVRERLLTEQDPEWKTDLTNDQRKLLTWLNNKYASWFVGPNAFFNQTATKIEGKTLSWLDLFNLDKDVNEKMAYYPGWFPKAMKTYEELNYEEGARLMGKQIGKGDIFGANLAGIFSIKNMKERALRAMTWYIEDTFEAYNDVRMSLPIKYMDNFVINNEKNYTHNLVFQFDSFNKSSLHKQYMEPVFHIGQALKTFLQFKKYGNGQPMFENTVGFLEKKLIGDIQNRVKRVKYTRLPITMGQIYNPFTGKKETFNVDLDKIIQQSMHWTSAITMWLKPFQGGGNGLQAKLLTYREAMKGSIASTFAHIDGDAIDFTLKDNLFADKIYFGTFTRDSMFGDLNKNKMWLLARKLNYIPDNYDYATNKKFLLSARNNAINESSMYKFMSTPEEYVSLTTMVAQLNHLKNPKTRKSLWDSYEVRKDENTGVYSVEWIGGIRGYEKQGKGPVAVLAPMEGLTEHEIAKLKKVHERMQGGYRKEEAANVELYVMGKSMIQFKKYFLRLLMNAVGGKREEVDLGMYKKMEETRIDPVTGEKMDVYEWLRRTNEGRWRTLTNFLLSYINLAGKEYRWSNLTTEQKQNLIDAMITINMFAGMYAMYLAFFGDDDDDDTFKKWWMNYLVMNVSQQYNPLDMLQIAQTATQPVAIARMYKSTQAFANMMVATGNLLLGSDPSASFTEEGQLRGWNEIMRSIPYLASFHDFASKMKNGNITEDWWVQKFENQWR